MKQQLLIFDLDGTLIDSRHDLSAGINLMRRHYNLPPLDVDTVAGFIGDGVRNLVKRSLAGETIDIDEAVRVNSRFYLEHIHDRTVLYPGVAAGLPALRAHGHVLALISNKGARACKIILDHFKIADFFASIIGGDSGLPLKPDPAAVRETMRLVNMNAAETWIIGDNHTDLAAARNAVVKSVYVSYGIGKTGPENATLNFADFNSLVEFFLCRGRACRGPIKWTSQTKPL
ncbi:MAG: HAD-IA family hydrolase [Kiritimatiellae bacterium]|nr:HAD-IA family hydrolase [Kiritimatiellia bacterium]